MASNSLLRILFLFLSILFLSLKFQMEIFSYFFLRFITDLLSWFDPFMLTLFQNIASLPVYKVLSPWILFQIQYSQDCIILKKSCSLQFLFLRRAPTFLPLPWMNPSGNRAKIKEAEPWNRERKISSIDLMSIPETKCFWCYQELALNLIVIWANKLPFSA